MGESCGHSCGQHNDNSAQDGLEIDPDMADCCRRELLERKRIEVAKQRLRSVDRSMARIDLRNQAVGGDVKNATFLSQKKTKELGGVGQSVEEDDFEWGSSGEEDDEDLRRIRDARLQQLQQRARKMEVARDLGLGTVMSVEDDKLLDIVEGEMRPCILHVALPGNKESDAVDELLDSLAHRCKDTRFLRVSRNKSQACSGQMSFVTPPGLVCWKNSEVVGQVQHSSFCRGNDLVEEKVVSFLKGLKVLQGSDFSEADGAVTSDSADSEQEDPWAETPCVLCGRRYAHTHIQATHTVNNASDDERYDSEESGSHG